MPHARARDHHRRADDLDHGPSVAAAFARALELERLAAVKLDLARLGARPDVLTDADRAELPDLGAAFDDGLVWAHHRALDALTTG